MAKIAPGIWNRQRCQDRALVVMETRHGASRQQILSFLELFPWPVTQSERQSDPVCLGGLAGGGLQLGLMGD